MSIDAQGRTVKLQGGEEVGFEKALIATGANVNILRVDGAGQEGIHYLRAFGNSDSIREAAAGAERVVLIGGSYIGCEVAASLRSKGTDCAIVMMEEVALSRSFGEEGGGGSTICSSPRGSRSTAERRWRRSRATVR